MSERTIPVTNFSRRVKLAGLPVDCHLRVQVYEAAGLADPSATDHQDDLTAESVEVEPVIVSDLDQCKASRCVVDVAAPAREAMTLSVRVGQSVVELAMVQGHRSDSLSRWPAWLVGVVRWLRRRAGAIAEAAK